MKVLIGVLSRYYQGVKKKRGGWQPFPTEHSDWSRAVRIERAQRSFFLYSRLNCTVLGGHRFEFVQCLLCMNGMLNVAKNLHVVGNSLLLLNAFYYIFLQSLLQIL